jgi:hypothetical protein
LFPFAQNRYNLSEKNIYIKLKVEHTINIMRGGSEDEWLRRHHFTRENWQNAEKRFMLDPEVRKEVSRLLYRTLNKLEH